ncbi:unnamed protein product, partial [Urochloa humidicola]
ADSWLRLRVGIEANPSQPTRIPTPTGGHHAAGINAAMAGDHPTPTNRIRLHEPSFAVVGSPSR